MKKILILTLLITFYLANFVYASYITYGGAMNTHNINGIDYRISWLGKNEYQFTCSLRVYDYTTSERAADLTSGSNYYFTIFPLVLKIQECNPIQNYVTYTLEKSSPSCIPITCSFLGKNCGSWSNNCGGTLNCGTCSSGFACSNGQCVISCTPTSWSPDSSTVCSGQSFIQTSNCGTTRNFIGTKFCPICIDTCSSLGYTCGVQMICGNSINCGTCGNGYMCIGGHCVQQPLQEVIETTGKIIGDAVEEVQTNLENLDKDIADEDLKLIADDLVPLAVENTAQLYALFYEEVNEEIRKENLHTKNKPLEGITGKAIDNFQLPSENPKKGNQNQVGRFEKILRWVWNAIF